MKGEETVMTTVMHPGPYCCGLTWLGLQMWLGPGASHNDITNPILRPQNGDVGLAGKVGGKENKL